MIELTPLSTALAPAVLAFERANRAYFAAFVSDRGDAFFERFDAWYPELIDEQGAGLAAFYALLDQDGSVAARFNLYDIADGRAVVGYRVAQRAAGRGTATAGVRELCRLAREGHGLHTLRAAVATANGPSQRVLAKAGFTPDGPAEPAALGGKQGSWYRRDLTADGPVNTRTP